MCILAESKRNCRRAGLRSLHGCLKSSLSNVQTSPDYGAAPSRQWFNIASIKSCRRRLSSLPKTEALLLHWGRFSTAKAVSSSRHPEPTTGADLAVFHAWLPSPQQSTAIAAPKQGVPATNVNRLRRHSKATVLATHEQMSTLYRG